MSARQILLNVLGGQCEICGSMEKLKLHHKDHNRANNQLSNIQLLCSKCHGRIHNRRLSMKQKALYVEIDEKLLEETKIHCIKENLSLREFVEDLLRDALRKKKEKP